jgi:hypothetical protein
MEKYMAAWNTVSRQYINRIQQEQGRSAGGGGIFLGESDGGNAQKAKYWMFVRLRVVACTLLYLCIQDGRVTLHGSMGLIEGISMNHLFSNIIEIKCLRSRVSEYLYNHWY